MIAAGIFFALVAGAIVYSVLSIIAASLYLSIRPLNPASPEPISIFKPLTGLDENLESNLRTFFEQDYPSFEILFAVRSHSDPAVAVVEKLQSEYSHVPSRLLITGDSSYPNAKVFSLQHMFSVSSNDLLVMSDSDTRVMPTLLQTISTEFQAPQLGIETCPYRAVPGPSIWSRLEATGMNTDFIAGILTARMLEGMRFAVGPTIAARRSTIQKIGGFERLQAFLAEDFVIGQFAAEAGQGVGLSSYVIEHHIGNFGFRESAAHRLRWVRSTRRSRPWGYLGQIFTMPVPLALLLCAVRPHWWPLLAGAIAVRSVSAFVMSRMVLQAKLRWLLLPLEDLAAFFFWIAGFFGDTIMWRGHRYRLYRDGRFEPVDP